VEVIQEIKRSTVAEIAAILGISVDTAMARLKRARREIERPGNSVAMEQAS
jgi:DNA-directed RNA polymerase specialized sigma24 family protein